jgi:hypothetical protein
MRNLQSHPTQRRDHYQELTDRIVAALEAGVAQWRRPWDPNACGGSNMPVNVATGHRYRGVNLFVLGMSPLTFTSGDPRWCSYRQAAARGWQVRKGEKATPVYFYKPIEIEDKTTDGGSETRRIPMLRTFSVFHASQIDGVPALEPRTATKIFRERVLHPETTPVIETAEDALAVALHETGLVDLDRIAELLGRSRETAIAELGERIFLDPEATVAQEREVWVTADAYLSGKIRDKLTAAAAAAALDPRYQRNVAALEKTLPEDLKPSDITARLGAPRIPADVVASFAEEVLGVKTPVYRHRQVND